MGPSFAVYVQPKWGSFLVLSQNIWSLPGRTGRPSVNQMQIENSLSYNLPHEWYLLTAPTVNAFWTESGRDRWLVPFGGGIGRTFSLGSQAIDLNITAYSNAIRPALFPKWQLSLQVTLLYPRKRR